MFRANVLTPSGAAGVRLYAIQVVAQIYPRRNFAFALRMIERNTQWLLLVVKQPLNIRRRI